MFLESDGKEGACSRTERSPSNIPFRLSRHARSYLQTDPDANQTNETGLMIYPPCSRFFSVRLCSFSLLVGALLLDARSICFDRVMKFLLTVVFLAVTRPVLSALQRTNVQRDLSVTHVSPINNTTLNVTAPKYATVVLRPFPSHNSLNSFKMCHILTAPKPLSENKNLSRAQFPRHAQLRRLCSTSFSQLGHYLPGSAHGAEFDISFHHLEPRRWPHTSG